VQDESGDRGPCGFKENLKLLHRMIMVLLSMVKAIVKCLKCIISGTCMHVHQGASIGASCVYSYLHPPAHAQAK